MLAQCASYLSWVRWLNVTRGRATDVQGSFIFSVSEEQFMGTSTSVCCVFYHIVITVSLDRILTIMTLDKLLAFVITLLALLKSSPITPLEVQCTPNSTPLQSYYLCHRFQSFMESTQPAARPDLYAEPRSVNVYGVVWHKASHTLRPLLTYCTSPSEF
jgi:hypothetical protein